MISRAKGFSLAEMIVALIIASMILTAVLAIHSRAEKIVGEITRKLDRPNAAKEILQLIEEDIDNVYASDNPADVAVSVENKMSPQGFSLARLKIERPITTKNRDLQTFEKIIWQTSYDYVTNSLILYRSHTGLISEDKMLDDDRAEFEVNYPFVPICHGMTYFMIELPKFANKKEEEDAFAPENRLNSWRSNTLPYGLIVSISFSDKIYKTLNGTLDVPPGEKITRVMAVDASKNISFMFTEQQQNRNSIVDSNAMFNRY